MDHGRNAIHPAWDAHPQGIPPIPSTTKTTSFLRAKTINVIPARNDSFCPAERPDKPLIAVANYEFDGYFRAVVERDITVPAVSDNELEVDGLTGRYDCGSFHAKLKGINGHAIHPCDTASV